MRLSTPRRPRGASPPRARRGGSWQRRWRIEWLLLLIVVWGGAIIFMHHEPPDSAPAVKSDAAVAELDGAAAFLDNQEAVEENILSEEEQRLGEDSAEEGSADEGDAGDAGEEEGGEGGEEEEGDMGVVEDGEEEELSQAVTEIQLDNPSLRVDDLRLQEDEQRETPPKRPFYWWYRFRQANGGFSNARQVHGVEDARPAPPSDGSCGGDPECSGHGYCHQGRCLCMVAYQGAACQTARHIGAHDLSLAYNGSYVLSREKLRKDRGVRFRTDPLEDPPPSKPFVRVPVSREVWEAQPNTDSIQGRFFNKCAVVGSSGLMRMYNHGERIDESELVVRFNRAPTHGFEKHVGTRTSLRFVSPINAGWTEGNETLLMPLPTKQYLYLQVVLHRKHPGGKLYLLDRDFNEYAASILPSLPTIGFLAVLMALQRCRHVTIYGFHTDSTYGIPYHYYNNEAPRRKLAYSHDLHEEHAKLMSLAQQGMLQMADPCAAGCEATSGLQCTNCPPGSTCTCEERYPMPVALPGFCRIRGMYSCFFPCPGGVEQCPGGFKATRCPKDFATKEAPNLHCATKDDVRVMAARVAAVNGTSKAAGRERRVADRR